MNIEFCDHTKIRITKKAESEHLFTFTSKEPTLWTLCAWDRATIHLRGHRLNGRSSCSHVVAIKEKFQKHYFLDLCGPKKSCLNFILLSLKTDISFSMNPVNAKVYLMKGNNEENQN